MFGARRAAENYKIAEKMLHIAGLEKERVRLEWISAAESPKFVKVVTEMVSDLKRLGPNPLKNEKNLRNARTRK